MFSYYPTNILHITLTVAVNIYNYTLSSAKLDYQIQPYVYSTYTKNK